MIASVTVVVGARLADGGRGYPPTPLGRVPCGRGRGHGHQCASRLAPAYSDSHMHGERCKRESDAVCG